MQLSLLMDEPTRAARADDNFIERELGAGGAQLARKRAVCRAQYESVCGKCGNAVKLGMLIAQMADSTEPGWFHYYCVYPPPTED